MIGDKLPSATWMRWGWLSLCKGEKLVESEQKMIRSIKINYSYFTQRTTCWAGRVISSHRSGGNRVRGSLVSNKLLVFRFTHSDNICRCSKTFWSLNYLNQGFVWMTGWWKTGQWMVCHVFSNICPPNYQSYHQKCTEVCTFHLDFSTSFSSSSSKEIFTTSTT